MMCSMAPMWEVSPDSRSPMPSIIRSVPWPAAEKNLVRASCPATELMAPFSRSKPLTRVKIPPPPASADALPIPPMMPPRSQRPSLSAPKVAAPSSTHLKMLPFSVFFFTHSSKATPMSENQSPIPGRYLAPASPRPIIPLTQLSIPLVELSMAIEVASKMVDSPATFFSDPAAPAAAPRNSPSS